MVAESENARHPAEIADATPHAASLIESLRDIGYSLDTALADVIDNSITAGATSIRLLADTLSEDPSIAILDDGRGMNAAELIEAMRPGSRNPRSERDSRDLGRFGLGLKSASFSQCRKLTVLSRQGGTIAGATWDLDEVARTNRWDIALHHHGGGIPWADQLTESGTLVVWQNLDRLDGGFRHDAERRSAHINAALSKAERHLRLVFHRFMDRGRNSLRISLNSRVLKPIDPFAEKNPKTQPDPEEVLQLAGGIVRIRSFTLPHHKEMGKAEWDELGGPEGHIKTQGFYVYRGERLIIEGSWLGLARQTELTKLCRIRVDIPNTMDFEWKIDVKKASAQLPPPVRERLKRVVERFVETSRRTYTRRGQKLTDHARLPMWDRVLKNGMIVYRPNQDHPVLTEFEDTLPENLRAAFRNCVGIIGASLPMEALHADMHGGAEAIGVEDAEPDAIDQAVRAMVPRLLEQHVSFEGIRSMLRTTDPFRGAWDQVETILSELFSDDQDTSR